MLVIQSCLTLLDPMDCSLLGFSVDEILQAKNTGVGCQSHLQGSLSDPGIKLRSPTLRADSLPAEPQGKPKNIGMGSLSLLQWIFPT